MAEIENIHCPICTQPIPSLWQNGLPPALATSVQRGVHRQFSHETDLTCLSPVFLLTQIKFADAKTKTFSSSTLFVLQFSNTMQSLLLFLFLLLADFAFFVKTKEYTALCSLSPLPFFSCPGQLNKWHCPSVGRRQLRLLRDFWDTSERLLRDFWEPFERL